jgi:hypothetical protein
MQYRPSLVNSKDNTKDPTSSTRKLTPTEGKLRGLFNIKHLKPYFPLQMMRGLVSNGKVMFVYRLSWIRAYSKKK